MLTDIFLNRYANVPLWTKFREQDRRFLVQAFRIIEEQVYPYYEGKKISEFAKGKWKTIHDLLSMEIGLKELSKRYYSLERTFSGKKTTYSGHFEWNTVCEKFVCTTPNSASLMQYSADNDVVDQFMKERISFFEIAFREFNSDVRKSDEELPRRVLKSKNLSARGTGGAIKVPNPGDVSVPTWPEVENFALHSRYKTAVEEFNTRARQANIPLHYHNGFVQITNDELINSEIEQPFWRIVSDPTWKNVDTDMKEALDRRDTGQRDPAFYAARALESAIKIISDEKGWTHGKEMGAHNYLDNLGSAKNGKFIEGWEKQALKDFFTNVRNPFAHAPGGAEMPELTPHQTDWAIETCMAWIKTLVQRI